MYKCTKTITNYIYIYIYKCEFMLNVSVQFIALWLQVMLFFTLLINNDI